MTQTLTNFLNGVKNKEYATKNGTHIHNILQHVVIDGDITKGDTDMIETISKHNELKPWFCANAQTEVPIAGVLNGRFTSRRIDRMIKDDVLQTIKFVDYKTDTTKTDFIEKYIRQIKEYAELLHSAYPNYKISGFILWVHDWQIEQIV